MGKWNVPRPIIYTALILAVLAMIPPVMIARTRATTTDLPRIQLQQDMAKQHRFGAQQPNPMFRDGRSMRPPVPGTVARGELRDDEHLHLGVVGDDWADEFPEVITVNREFLERGREQYDIFCAVCHGISGYGDGQIDARAARLQAAAVQGTIWVPPTSLHDPGVREQPVGQIYNTITNGIGNMAAYRWQIRVEDRWAVAAYVKALQLSQNADPDLAAVPTAGAHAFDHDTEPKKEGES